MSISNFINASILMEKLGKQDVALALVCSAIDGTAKKLYPEERKNNVRYKDFLKDYMRIITTFGFPGISAGGIRIKCENIPDIKTDSNGMVGIEDIIYHIIRCGLIHQCEIDQKLEFVDETFIGDFKGTFKIPKKVIWGLIMAVVLSEKNSNERIDDDIKISIGRKRYHINDMWGNEKEINSYITINKRH